MIIVLIMPKSDFEGLISLANELPLRLVNIGILALICVPYHNRKPGGYFLVILLVILFGDIIYSYMFRFLFVCVRKKECISRGCLSCPILQINLCWFCCR